MRMEPNPKTEGEEMQEGKSSGGQWCIKCEFISSGLLPYASHDRVSWSYTSPLPAPVRIGSGCGWPPHGGDVGVAVDIGPGLNYRKEHSGFGVDGGVE